MMTNDDTDADLTALIADVREVIERGSDGVSDHQALRLVDAVERLSGEVAAAEADTARLTRERDDARAENERLRGDAEELREMVAEVRRASDLYRSEMERRSIERTAAGLKERNRAEAAEAEVADLRTRLADVRALASRMRRSGRHNAARQIRRALDGPQDGGEGR